MKHPNSLLSVNLVLSRLQRQEAMKLYDKYQMVYNNFSPEIKASEDGILMFKKLKYFKKSNVGSVAPNFTLKDINNITLTLRDFRGEKYILLDFWASWCAPCIEDQRYLKKMYSKFSKNDFEIISISRDTDLDQWKKAISKHKTDVWKQVSIISDLTICSVDLMEKDEKKEMSVDVNYFVSGIPHYVLIDKNGIIIGKWKGSGELNMRDIEEKITRLFN